MKKNLFGKNIKLAMLLSVVSFLGAQEVMAVEILCPYAHELRLERVSKAGQVKIVGNTYAPEFNNPRFQSPPVLNGEYDMNNFTFSLASLDPDALKCTYTNPGRPDLDLTFKNKDLANRCIGGGYGFNCPTATSKKPMKKAK